MNKFPEKRTSHAIGPEKSLNLKNPELKAIIDSSYDGIWITDGKGQVLIVNEAYQRITGIRAEDVLGRNMRDLVRMGFFDKSVTLEVLKQRRRVTINQTVPGAKQILTTGNPIFDENGNIFLVVTNVRDVTELLRLQEKLAQEKQQSRKYKNELNMLRLRQMAPSIISRSEQMTKIVHLAEKVAHFDSTVLITGESGTGKELIARFIHDCGKGKQKPFMGVNCAAIPDQLLESELFGYMGGAFTGAKKDGKPGLFELAQNGTLFLDEIGDLSPFLQAKILRVIQEKEVFRLGASKGISVNARIITATNRDLSKMLNEGTFREDLYYRLMVVPLHLPPLRERPEDIPLLITIFLDEFNSRFESSKTLSPQVLNRLLNYHWPGNIRELKNIIERIVLMSPGNEIGLENLPGLLRPGKVVQKSGIRLKDMIEDTERLIIEESFHQYRCWKKVAEILGIDRVTLYRKAKRYNLKHI
jgi:PAS domain S-box-containing protein